MEEKKGVYKKKGAAEESDAQEAKNDVNDMEGGMTNAGDVKGVSKKKGGAAKPKQKRKEDKLKKTAKQLADPDTNLKDFSRKLKKYRKTKKQIKEIKDDGVAKKKGAGRTVKQLKDKKQEMQDTKAHKKMGVKAYNKKIGRLNKKIARKGGAQHIDGKEHGAASFEGGLHAKNIKHSKSASGEVTHDGAKKAGAAMGFTQNFGPARQNSYAKGAARVAQIMGKGAFKKKGAADDTGSPHEHSKRPNDGFVDDSGMGGFTGNQPVNKAYKLYQTSDIAAGRGPDIPNANVAGGSIPGPYPKMDAVSEFNSNVPLSRGMTARAPKGTPSNPKNEKQRNSMIKGFTDFMKVPTNSPRLVGEELKRLKASTHGNLVSDIFTPGSSPGAKKGKNHGKKKH